MDYKNRCIETQLAHRTIREFTEEAIPADTFQLLMEVAKRTASSNGLQASSIIRVTDPAIRQVIAEVCTQEYVARAPELLIFIVDQYRNSQITKEKTNLDRGRDMDRFFSAYTDACITAQNVVNAAESLGLGTVYLGSILNDSQRICDILELPQLTFPVVGLGIGYPNQEPQLKPRMDMGLRVYENHYNRYENYLEEIKDYDAQMVNYYDLRDTNNRVDCFSDQVVAKLNNIIQKRLDLVHVITRQGFDSNIDPNRQDN